VLLDIGGGHPEFDDDRLGLLGSLGPVALLQAGEKNEVLRRPDLKQGERSLSMNTATIRFFSRSL